MKESLNWCILEKVSALSQPYSLLSWELFPTSKTSKWLLTTIWDGVPTLTINSTSFPVWTPGSSDLSNLENKLSSSPLLLQCTATSRILIHSVVSSYQRKHYENCVTAESNSLKQVKDINDLYYWDRLKTLNLCFLHRQRGHGTICTIWRL